MGKLGLYHLGVNTKQDQLLETGRKRTGNWPGTEKHEIIWDWKWPGIPGPGIQEYRHGEDTMQYDLEECDLNKFENSRNAQNNVRKREWYFPECHGMTNKEQIRCIVAFPSPTCWHQAALSSQSRLVLGLCKLLGLGRLYLKQEWREWLWSHYPTLHWCRLSQTATSAAPVLWPISVHVTSSNAVHHEAGTCLLRLGSSPWLNLPP